MPARGICEFCERPVLHRERAAFHVTSCWEAERAQGGANHLLMKKRDPTVIAHAQCAEIAAHRAKLGLAPEQEELWVR